MFTKEKFLEDKISLHIKSPESKEKYVKLIQKLIDLGWETYDGNSAENFFHNDWVYLPYIGDLLTIHPRNNPDGYKEIQVSDIIGTQFEVGKWYKIILSGKYPHYLKFTSINDKHGTLDPLGYVHNLDKWEKGYSIDLKDVTDYNLIEDLSEIQQYLPEGHPDKIQVAANWWLNLKPGDKIKCTEVEQKGPNSNIYGGAGWKSNEVFTVRRVDNYETYGIIFIEEYGQDGIYDTSCAPYSEPKPLTVDDLVEGEVYYHKCLQYSYIVKFKKLDGISITGEYYIDLETNNYYKNYRNTSITELRSATPSEKKWLLTCIKQDKFIEQSELDKYDDEDNLISKFKVGDWVYDEKDSYNTIGQITKFIEAGKPYCKMWYSCDGLEGNGGGTSNKLRLATPSEIAKVTSPPFEFNKWYKPNNDVGLFFVKSENTGYGFKNFNYNLWFENTGGYYWELKKLIPATPEEVSERLLSYAKEKYPIGSEIISIFETSAIVKSITISSTNDEIYADFGKYALYYEGKWAEIISKPESKTSEVNRNVYYEVSNQDQYNEILDWLRSKGEKVYKGAFIVNDKWRYVHYYIHTEDWHLDNDKQYLSKAEFKFKNNPGIREQILNCTDYAITDLNIPDIFYTPCTEQECYKSHRTIPQIEKVTNRFKTSPVRKRSLPEIY